MNVAAFSQNEWYLQYGNYNHSTTSVHFINISTGWAVCQNGTILKTTNSGKNWSILQELNKNLRSVQFLDMNTGWVGGNDTTSLILKTTNGGINWIRQSSGNTHFIFNIHFKDTNNGWAIGEMDVIKTTNGGTNWVSKYNGLQHMEIETGFFIDQNTGWVGGFDDNAIIRKTTDGGSSWSYTSNADTIRYRIRDIDFIDINTGWAIGVTGDIIKSTNGGNSWRKIFDAPYMTSLSIQFINSNTGWIVGVEIPSIILNTVDGGENWSTLILDKPPFSNYMGILNSVFFIDSVNGWVTGGGIISTVNTNDSNDIGLLSIDNPVLNSNHYVKCSNNESIIPEVTVKNFGPKNQNNFFNVHLEIKQGNSIIYQDTKQDTISAGQTHTIDFDPYTPNFDLQTYNYENYFVKSWTSLTSDTAYDNDTAETSFSVVNPNYGYSDISGYYFLNSSSDANCIPDQPVFNWEDTTGSVSLISNAQTVVPYTEYNNFYFCGSFRLPDVLPTGKKFRFFDTCYDTIIIANNGIIGFGNASLSRMNVPFPDPVPSVNAPHPAIFPLWYWVNFQDPEITGRNLKYKITEDKFIITYDRAPLYNAIINANDYVTYQVILEIDDDCSTENGKIKVQYNYDNSGSTFLNNYYNNMLNAMTVGIQNSTGTVALQYRRSESDHTVTVPGPLFGSSIALEFAPINSVLPVELESFTYSVNENNVNLFWIVSSQINNSGFEIERSYVENNSSDEWIKVGNVSGSGSTTNVQQYTFSDRNLPTGKYAYRLKQIDFNGNFEYFELINSVQIGVPKKFRLSQNYPNPFNPVTFINFDIQEDSKIVLKIYDNTGREVRMLVNEFKLAGYYKVELNGSDLSSGVYFCNLQTDKFSDTKKMILLK